MRGSFRRRVLAPLTVLTVGAALVSGSLGAGSSGAATRDVIDDVRLNQIQVIGSHNSYHRVPSQAEMDLRRSFIGAGEDQLEYQHEPLPTQFGSQKVRQIELDAFVDHSGGLYANPLLRSTVGLGPYDPAMQLPGIKVFHIQDVDYETTCLTLVACLSQVKGWSDANPNHVPIAILLELKDTPLVVGSFTFTTPEPWTAAAMDELDADIRSVFAPGDMITPDDVRGTHATLEEAVTTDGWPTLRESRGKVMFLMDNGGAFRTRYLTGHPGLQGRVVFTNSTPGQPDAAFVEHNDSLDEAEIQSLVLAGYVVRTRADGDTLEARAEDTTKRDAAFRSGAQWVSTDYPVPGMAFGFTSSYFAEIPGGVVARCNPVNAPPTCRDAALEAAVVPPPTITLDTTTSTSSPGTTVPGTTSTTSGTGPTGSTVPPPTTGSSSGRPPVSTAPGATPRSGSPRFTG
jgi:hypothetical protein